MSELYNDGTVQYASRVITINSVAYVADNITVTRPVNVVRRTNQLNEPSGSAGTADFATMTATLQLATGSTAEPPLGQVTSAITFDSTIGAETWRVTGITRNEEKASEKKLNASFIKMYN